MNQYKNFLISLTLIMLFSCSTEKVKEQPEIIHEVKITQALLEESTTKLSEITKGEIEYIQLESAKDHLLDKVINYYLTENEIIAFAKKQIYVFDRKNGQFLREIGHAGRDPGAYKKVIQAFPFDEDRLLVYTGGLDPNSYNRYKTSGEIADRVFSYAIEKEPDMMKNIFGEIITSIAPVNDTCFVGYVWNINGKQEAKLIVFNENNHRINVHPQYKKFDYDIHRDGISVYSWNAKYYKLNEQLHFFERFTDTVFTVSVDTLQAKYILQKGKNENATATDFSKNKGNVPYSMFENLFESERFLFFKTRVRQKSEEAKYYYGFFDKKEKTTKVSTIVAGIENDIDNFIPLKFYSTNNSGEIIGSLDAYEVQIWFSENPDKGTKLPPHLQKLEDINETDNPVVMIAKLRK